MAGTTILSKSPGPSFYLDGMQHGMGINAITGEISESALDPNFKVVDKSSPDSQEKCLFRAMSDMIELKSSDVLGLSGSLTFPVDGLKVGAKDAFDFTNSNQSSTSVLLIAFDWERQGQAKQVSDAKLSDEARSNLVKDSGSFRDKYGDYFIYQISYMSKFTAIWKCTTESSSDMKEFKTAISGSIIAKEMDASGSFTTKLSRAATDHNVTVEVQYNVVGDAGKTEFDKGDILKTFNSFRDAASPIPSKVLLFHYSVIDHKVPATISIEPEVFQRVCDVFTNARFVLFLIGVVPGIRSVRLARHNKLDKLFKEIHAKRLTFQNNPEALKDAIHELTKMHDMLWLRLERQDLVTEMRSLTYDDLKRKFAIDHENDNGAWVRSSQNKGEYVLGRIGFSQQEQNEYAISHQTVAEVHVDGQFTKQQVGALEFPGTTGINGFVVGLLVQDCWKDGTNGWWCVGQGLKLGIKQAKVMVKTEGSRGMHWRLDAYYIPSSEYDE